MAGVSGTEVLYKRESKLGLTTLTFRKRRYMSPNVIVKGDPSMSASTGNLESGGMCALLDVGLYCPHCAGAITAQLSGSHSKLLITKGDGEHQCTSAIQLEESPQLEYYSTTDAPGSTTEATTVSSTEASNIRTTKHAQIIKIHTERDTTEDTSNMLESFVEQSPKETLDTFSSSDYESLDRDSCVTSMNSHHNSTDTCVSVASCTGGITSPRADEAYCSLASSYHSTTPEPSGESPQRVLSRMSPQSSKYSSLPHDVGLSSNGYSSSEERLVLDSMHVDLSDTNDEVLVDELLSDEVIDEEYHSLMSGSVTKSLTSHEGSNQELYGDNPRHGLLSEDSFDVSRSEDNISDRSASPELFVDDVLENMESEIISGEATLPRVFALQKSGITRKRQRHRQMHEQSSVDSVEWDTPSRKPKPGEIIIEGSASLQRRKIRDMVKHKYKNVQKSIKFSAQQKTDFTHENFFEDVLEALTDLEGGFTDWAENDSDNHDTARSALDSSSARFMLCENDDDEYKDSLDVYNISRKTATSSCECIADDRSRDLDSSSEHIAFTAETTSEASTLEGYDSSSECSYSGLVGPMHDDAGLFEQLIQETQILTDDLMIKDANASATKSANLEPCVGLVRPDRRVSPIRDQCDIIDEVHLEESPQHFDVDLVDTARLEYQKVSKKPNIHADVIRPALPIPTIIEPCDDSESYVHMTSTPKNPHKQFFSGNTSDEDDIDSSLENLLTCNAIHCSTSDLDEPFSNELNHMSHVGDENPSDTSHEVSGESNISQDFQKCLNTDTTEVDEFVPEMGSDKIKTETLQESTQYVMSQHVSDHTSKIVSKESKNQTERNDIVQENTSKNDSFKNAVKCGQWDSFVNESDTKVATFESKDNTTKNQDQEFMKYVLSKSSQTQHSKEHNTDLDACLDQVCQTCDFKPNTPDEIVKNEEVITKEVTLVFAWPKKMKIPKQLTPGMPPTKSSQPFRTIHLRRVMRVTDVDMEVIEGPTIETVQYERDGSTTKSISVQGSPQKALLQADKQLEQQDLGKQQATSLKAANSSECTKMTHIISDSDRTRLTEESSDIVEEELSHYNTTSDAFIMPELDMHNTQQSELLFDMSSSISMEYLTDMENKVDVVYEDHQKAMEQIYEQATYDMDSDNGKNMDFNGIDTTDDATTRKPPDESSTIEDLEYMPYMSDQSVHDDGDVVETDRLVFTCKHKLTEPFLKCVTRQMSNGEQYDPVNPLGISNNINNRSKVKHEQDKQYPYAKQCDQMNKNNICRHLNHALDLRTYSPMDKFLFENDSDDNFSGRYYATSPAVGLIITAVESQHDITSNDNSMLSNDSSPTGFQYGHKLIYEPQLLQFKRNKEGSNHMSCEFVKGSGPDCVINNLGDSHRHVNVNKPNTQLLEQSVHEHSNNGDDFWDKYLFGNKKIKTNTSHLHANPNVLNEMGKKSHRKKTHTPRRTRNDMRHRKVPITNAKPVRYFCCRQSENAPGKDPEAKFIEQNERNVLLLDTGKYFTPHPRDPDLNIDRVVYVNNRNSQDVHVMETVCPRCSDIYIFDDEQNMIRTSPNDLMEEKLLTRLQHPVPCARCIRLEREIKIKLEELSVMVEKIGRQKSLSDDKGTSMTDSIDDLQNLSQETVENIHTLQQSISSIQHVRKGDTPHVPGTDSLTSKQTHQITPEVQQNVKDIKYSLPSDNGHAMVSITPTT